MIQNLSQCTRLRKLNLSFNRIAKIEGLSNLLCLETLELGKNQIRNCDLLSQSKNFPLLQELYLYMNYISKIPLLSMPSLRILNVNRNAELTDLHCGYCPMLEQVSASYCAIA